MAKMPLTTGAYEARSLTVSAQRCVNLYMEKNPEESVFPYTCYPTPGLTVLVNAGKSWRGLYATTAGTLYGVCDNVIYHIQTDFTLTNIGTVATFTGPVQMVDNSNFVILVDGSNTGYSIEMSNDTVAIIDPEVFYGGNSIAWVDGYFIVNRPGTFEWFISGANTAKFDALDFASKSAFLDRIVGVAVSNRYIYLFGTQTTEVWFNAGDTNFTFQRMPGVYLQYGCSSAATLAQYNGQVFWLCQSPQGQALVCKTSQFQAVQISTFAISGEISTYGDISDAIGYVYQLNGHAWYVLTFPSANKTWQYDIAENMWEELVWTDENGGENRHRANCHAFAFGTHIVGDFENGNLYSLDQNNYTDFGGPIRRIRSFPHIMDDSANRVMYREFIADMEVGNGGSDDIQMQLRWSDTRGKSWGSPIYQTLGAEGDYLRSIQFQRLGMARGRVFEVSWAAPVQTCLSGAFVEAKSAKS